ncbi:MAG TPA: sigma factor, partial [Polyangiaceae bacterium]
MATQFSQSVREGSAQPTAPARPRQVVGRKSSENIFDRWQALIIADREGDRGAYDVFLAELRSWLTRYFTRRMRDGGVEDAVQETLIAVFLKRRTYSTEDALGPWLMTIAYRKWVDSVRRRARGTFVPLDETHSVEDHG